MSTWQITYGGVTQDAATWGITNLKRTRKSAKTGTVTFDVPGPIDGAGPFAQWQPLSILRNGVPWFAGVITKPPRKGSGQSESLSFEVSDPWYWLEKTVFQQQWVTTDLVGDALTTLTTTRSNTILGQSLAGVKMNSGQVMLEVLIYAQYAYQMLPFPATVDVTTSLPAAPAVAAPFIIGALTPSIVVPYMQVRDKSCADILRMMMKYSPDAVAWMDYTTTPPTLNIDKRASVKKNVISVLDGTVVTEFNPTPRYDLQVPVVVAKWEEKNTINGTTYDSVTVDMYPPAPGGVNASVWASQPRAWVQTIDLVGGQTTQQFANIKTIARPTVSGSEVALTVSKPKEVAPLVLQPDLLPVAKVRQAAPKIEAPRKKRSDALIYRLTPDQRAAIARQIGTGASYRQIVALCASWGVKTSVGALTEYLRAKAEKVANSN